MQIIEIPKPEPIAGAEALEMSHRWIRESRWLKDKEGKPIKPIIVENLWKLRK